VLAHIVDRTKWLGIFDLDEFVFPPSDTSFISVLSGFGDAEAVLLPWLSFGSSGHTEQPATVIHGFTRRGPAGISRSFLKPFLRPNAVVEMLHHNPRTINGRKVLADGSPVGNESFIALDEERLQKFKLVNNHYRLQSLRYFTDIKTSRPEVHESVAERRKKISFFEDNDPLWNSVSDTRLSEMTPILATEPSRCS